MTGIAKRFPKEKITAFISIVTGAVILCSLAIYNGFPFLYPDSGTYISAVWDSVIPRDRPLTYSFFLRHSSLAVTLWIPAVLQCLLISWLIFRCFRHFTSTKQIARWHLGTIVVLTFATALGTVTTLLIPDIFTSVIVVSGALLLFAENLSQRAKWFLHLLFLFAVSTHMSHYPMTSTLLASGIVVLWLKRKNDIMRLRMKRALVLAAMIPGAIVFTTVMNRMVGGRWQFNPGSGHVFMMNRLLQCGILSDYLAEECPKHPYSLCEFNPQPGLDLLWDPRSPLNQKYGWENDGWAKAKPEYDSIIGAVFSQPRFIARYIACDFRDGAKQLVTFETMPMISFYALKDVSGVIQWRYPADYKRWANSKQGKDGMRFETIDLLQYFVVGISAMALLIVLFAAKLRSKMSGFLGLSLWFFAAMIFNALTVVSVAMIDTRFQARLIWLLPLLFALYLANSLSKKRGAEISG